MKIGHNFECDLCNKKVEELQQMWGYTVGVELYDLHNGEIVSRAPWFCDGCIESVEAT